jgi:hypothetical protein
MDPRSKQLKLLEILMMIKILLISYTLKLMVRALTKVKKRPALLELHQPRGKDTLLNIEVDMPELAEFY